MYRAVRTAFETAAKSNRTAWWKRDIVQRYIQIGYYNLGRQGGSVVDMTTAIIKGIAGVCREPVGIREFRGTSPVPIGKSQTRIAGSLAQDAFEEIEVPAVPRQEKKCAVFTLFE
jgi:hypothetical protein